MVSARRRPPYAVYLRVFEPVEHLPAAQRDHWTAYARSRPRRGLLEAAEFADSVRRLARRPPQPVPAIESGDAVLLDVDGRLYVCPQQTRLRALTELGSLDDHLVGLLGLSPSAGLHERAVADLAAYASGGGQTRLSTRAVTWQVPVAWFVPFAADERQLELREGEPRMLRYRTSMSSARRRCARGLRTARAHLEDADVVGEIEQVSRWLEQFDSRSQVELDYAALVDLLDDAHLLGDDSAADVADGLAALAEGDQMSAAAAYRRWSTRWHRVELLARAS